MSFGSNGIGERGLTMNEWIGMQFCFVVSSTSIWSVWYVEITLQTMTNRSDSNLNDWRVVSLTHIQFANLRCKGVTLFLETKKMVFENSRSLVVYEVAGFFLQLWLVKIVKMMKIKKWGMTSYIRYIMFKYGPCEIFNSFVIPQLFDNLLNPPSTNTQPSKAPP